MVIKATARKVAPAPATPTIATPDLATIEKHATALAAQIVEHEKRIASNQATVDATPIGQIILQLHKEAQAMRDKLKKDMEPLQLTHEKPMESPFGKFGWQKRITKSPDPAVVRELAPQYAKDVIVETVETKALEALTDVAVKLGKLPVGIMDQILNDPRSKAREKVAYAFTFSPLNKKA